MDLYKHTPLHYAAWQGNLKVVEYLVEKGANLNAKNNIDQTPLHYAASKGHLEVAKYLVKNGADIKVQNKGGEAPLDLAKESGYSDVEEILKGAQQDLDTNYDSTSLSSAFDGEVEDRKVHPIRHRRHKPHRDHHRKRRSLENEHESLETKEPKVSAASSSAVRQTSWINKGVVWVKELVASVKNVINRLPAKNDLSYTFKKTQKSLEFSTSQQYKFHDQKARIQSEKQHGKSEFSTNQAFGFSNFLSNENTAFAHCIADAMDNNSAKRYQDLKNKGVEVVPNMLLAVNFALNKFEKFVREKIEGLNIEERDRIHTELINVRPEIIASLERGIEYSGNVGLDDVLKKCERCFCKNILSPKSEEVSAHLSDIEVTTFGNNLGR